jgi:predicted nucleic acid-binding protein
MLHTGGLRVSTIVAGELFTWARRANASPKRLAKLQELLGEVDVLPVDLAIAEQFGEIRASLLDAGGRCPEMDLLIAATALVYDLTVVTHNTADFQNIPDLRVEDWLIP